MFSGLPVGLGLGFGLVILVALMATLFWCTERGNKREKSGEKPEIWMKSSKKSKKLEKSDKTRKGKLESTSMYEEDKSYTTVDVIPNGNHHCGDKKKKKGGLGKIKRIESEEAEYLDYNEQKMRIRSESEGEYLSEEDYGDGYGGYQDIRGDLAKKSKPALGRASTEEAYENDTNDVHQDIRGSLAKKPKPALARESTEEAYENDTNGGSYQDIRGSLAKKPKPGLERASTEETRARGSLTKKLKLTRASTEETYENDTELKHQNFANKRQETTDDDTYENGENYYIYQ